MATDVSSVVSHFPSAQDGFTTTTSGSVSSGATTVGLNSVAGYTNGQTVVMIIDPDDSTKKQAFTGVVDTSGVQITSVVWTSGTNQAHAAGATVVDYESATMWSMMTKGILVHADQDGTLKAGAVDVAGVLASDVVTTAKILASNVTTAKIADSNVTGAKVADGFPVNHSYAELATSSTTTTVLPADTSDPQITEGTEILTVSHTPLSATNYLLVEAVAMILPASTYAGVGAIFRDATAAAITAGTTSNDPINPESLKLRVRVVAGSTSATTFRLRVGPGAAGTVRWNGAGAAYFGSIPKTTLTVTEIKAS